MNIFTEQSGKYKKGYILRIDIDEGDVVVPEVDQDVFFDDILIILEHYSDSVQIKLKELGLDIEQAKLEKEIKVIDGEYVEQDSIILEVPTGFAGISTKRVLATKSGIVGLKSLDKGVITINSVTKNKKVIKGINGKVKKIVPGKYIELQTDIVAVDALVRFNPQNGLYTLKYVEDLNKFIESASELNSLEGIGVFYNGVLEMQELKKLAVLGVESVITVGIDADKLYADREFFTKYKVELILLEGFGLKELNPKLKQIIAKNDGMLFRSSADGIDIVNKGTVPSRTTKAYTALKRGDTVRLYCDKYWGRYAKYYSADRSSDEYARIKITGKKNTVPISINNFVKIV